MSRTPSKNLEISNTFTPKDLKTPNKEVPGIPKTVYTHVSTLHGLICDWKRIRDKGTRICKTISALKLHEFTDNYFPQQLGPLTQSLLEASDGLKQVVDDLKTPNKEVPGIPKTVYTHVSTLHGLICDWKRIRDKGTRICKTISALKLHEFTDNYFPQQLGPLTQSLLEASDGLKQVVDGALIIKKQLEAVSKLQPAQEPVIMTWSATHIFECVNNICNSLQEEYELKLCITENIAHCRDEKLLEVYTSAWEFDIYFKIEQTAFLFAEMGLNEVT